MQDAAENVDTAPAAQGILWTRSERRIDMADAIVIVIVVVIVIFAGKSAAKHFKGEGACCGGGGSCAAGNKTKTLLDPVIGRKTLHISGMHCQNCVDSVTKCLNQIDGVSASVSLENQTAVVSYDREVSETDLKRAVKKAGFSVDHIV